MEAFAGLLAGLEPAFVLTPLASGVRWHAAAGKPATPTPKRSPAPGSTSSPMPGTCPSSNPGQLLKLVWDFATAAADFTA